MKVGYIGGFKLRNVLVPGVIILAFDSIQFTARFGKDMFGNLLGNQGGGLFNERLWETRII